MKNLGFILVGGVTVPILLLVGIYILRPSGVPPQPRLVISIEKDIAEIEASLAEQQATVQAKLDALNTELAQLQSNLDTQIETWRTETKQLQSQLDMLATTTQNLETEISTLEISRTIQLTEYQTQLDQTRQKYQTELEQLQVELEQKQAQLNILNAEIAERMQ